MHIKFLMLPQTLSTPSFSPSLLPSPSLLLQIIGDYQHQRSLNTLYLLSRTPAIQNFLTEMMSCLQLFQTPSGKGGEKKEVISFLPQKTMNH